MIFTCPVEGCGVLHEMGSDHQDEPCTACWRKGWRVDGAGNLHRLSVVEQAAAHTDVH